MSYSPEGSNRITSWTTCAKADIPQEVLNRFDESEMPQPPGNVMGTYNPDMSNGHPSCISITTSSREERANDEVAQSVVRDAVQCRIDDIIAAVSKAISFGDITFSTNPESQAREVAVNTSYLNGALIRARFRESDLNDDGTIVSSAPNEELNFPEQVIAGITKRLMRCACIREISDHHGKDTALELTRTIIESVFAAVRHVVATKCDIENVAHNIKPGSHDVTTAQRPNLVGDMCDYAVFEARSLASLDVDTEDTDTDAELPYGPVQRKLSGNRGTAAA